MVLFALTVECIRRYYNGENSPLSATLVRYRDFFNLFEDFCGYVEFFLLQGMVAENFTCVKFFMPFDGFAILPLQASMEAYRSYNHCAIDFIEAPNRRILEFCEKYM